MDAENKPEDCNGNCNIITKDIGGMPTEFCQSCTSLISYTKKRKISTHKNSDDIYHENTKQIHKLRKESNPERKAKSEKYKLKIDIKSEYNVRTVSQGDIGEWLLKKHYAKRIPPIKYSFGLYDSNNVLQGACTYGMPARALNDGQGCFKWSILVNTFELNRLIVNDGLPTNVLSFFVGQTLKQLPKPVCIVSYADENNNHHGYIYQATNWIYTGETEPMAIFTDTRNGKPIHQRTIVSRFGSSAKKSLPDYVEVTREERGKHRYYMFLGNKKERREMMRNFKLIISPYPKGKNENYDASFETSSQLGLF